MGSLAGPAGGGLGAGTGAMLGEMAKGNEELEEAQETITALTEGDVQTLIEKGMGEQEGMFEGFVSKIQSILMIAGLCLVAYLAIPIFVAKKCSKDEVKRQTRAPFPPKDL